MTCNKM